MNTKEDKELKKLLVIRFSAMGDVAMTVPVLHQLAVQNPSLRITVLTRNRFASLFEWLPANVIVKGIDLDAYKGVSGLTTLFRQLHTNKFDAVCDLHDVLRTKYLRTLFTLSGTRVAVINKGRKDKHALIGNAHTMQPLRPMVERYADVFKSLGLHLDLTTTAKVDMRNEDFTAVRAFAGTKAEGEKWIGIAPFAAHAQKIYPLDSMQQVVNALSDKGFKVFLFGAGKDESAVLDSWQRTGVSSVCGKLGGLHNEMLLMSQLDLMLSMDSANMHIASIIGTPVVSIWGATHPKAGFTGFGQPSDNILQCDDLTCRPCSIYGNKPCQFGNLRCMNISPDIVVQKITDLC